MTKRIEELRERSADSLVLQGIMTPERAAILFHLTRVPSGIAQAFPEFRIQSPVEALRKQRISEAVKKHFSDPRERDKISLSQGGPMVRIFPLALRGAGILDMMELTDLGRRQVQNSLFVLRKEGRLKRPTDKEQKETKRKAHLAKNDSGQKATPDYQNSLTFARRLLEMGLVGEGITHWNELLRLYKVSHRDLPERFSERLRLEVYLVSYTNLLQDPNIKDQYLRTGEAIDAEWFVNSLADHEKFIAQKG